MISGLEEYFKDENAESFLCSQEPGRKPAEKSMDDSSVDFLTECWIVHDLLPSYVDSDCNQHTVDFINKHLERCDKCSDTVENMRSEVRLTSITDMDTDVRELKKAMDKRLAQRTILLAALFASIACVVFFFFIGRSERMKAESSYQLAYNKMVSEYNRQIEAGEEPTLGVIDSYYENYSKMQENKEKD